MTDPIIALIALAALAPQHHHPAPPAPTLPDPPTASVPHNGSPPPHRDHTESTPDLTAAPPQIPSDHAADRYFSDMVRARAQLRRESGGMAFSRVLIDRLELTTSDKGETYQWDAEAWFGGDINRLTLKTEGEGDLNGELENAEVQALWSHALDPWFNLQMGARQDLRAASGRSYFVAGIEGLAPYWIELDAALFLSHRGEIFARVEASHDMRITNAVTLQPRLELEASFQDIPSEAIGSGVTDLEAGLRLDYAVAPRFRPYIGWEWERKLGRTAAYARNLGDAVSAHRLVAGVRFWF